jgi:hypothetical protein
MKLQNIGYFAGTLVVLTGLGLYAQQPPPAPAAKDFAPIDLTGYWVSVITQDWRFRVVTPAKGDYASVPLTAAALSAADAWDPAKDEAAGEQCRSYGAPAVMRNPERLHITWQDDNTLKIETDTGQQTRLFHFGNWKPAANAPATWQGDSVATWEIAGPPARGGRGPGGGGGGPGGGGPAGGPAAAPGGRGGAGGGRGMGGGPQNPRTGSLNVVTTHLRPGYLRRNGIPYSDKTVLTENFDLIIESYLTGSHRNEQWLTDTTIVHDPTNLQVDWVNSLNFKKEPDGSKWDPQPCSAR